MFFRGALRLVFVLEGFFVGLIKLEVFGGHDDELAGDAVFHGVEAGSLLAGFGFGAGGVLGIPPINFGSVDFGAGSC